MKVTDKFIKECEDGQLWYHDSDANDHSILYLFSKHHMLDLYEACIAPISMYRWYPSEIFKAIERNGGRATELLEAFKDAPVEHSGCVPSVDETDIVYRLERRAEIRRQIATRKSVQEGKPDRISDLLEDAAKEIKELREKITGLYEDAAGADL